MSKVKIKHRFTGEVMFEGDNLIELCVKNKANLREADLRGANLGGVDLQEADLQEANLQGADLQEADLGGVDLRGATLRGVDLRGADLGEANLLEADLRRADLQEANLQGADLRRADLGEADLQEANLQGADLPNDIPKFHPELLKKLAEIVTKNPKKLQMDSWHTCESTHCISGWYEHLGGFTQELVEKYSLPTLSELAFPSHLRAMIYESNENALEYLKLIVGEEAK